jgi:hypothetical protein
VAARQRFLWDFPAELHGVIARLDAACDAGGRTVDNADSPSAHRVASPIAMASLPFSIFNKPHWANDVKLSSGCRLLVASAARVFGTLLA